MDCQQQANVYSIEADPKRRKILGSKLSECIEVPIAEDAELLDALNECSFISQFKLLSA
jgi:hypothetical protein